MTRNMKRPASIDDVLEFWCESFPERRCEHSATIRVSSAIQAKVRREGIPGPAGQGVSECVEGTYDEPGDGHHEFLW